jgi:C-terminal processing protease CtpA/Prc
MTDKGGAAEAAHTAGNIGGDILKRFTVVLDYAHQKLWLEPNALNMQREVFDRSGLWVGRAADGGISVIDVVAGSAAATSGIRAGDEILSVNGKNAHDVALYELRDQFKGAVGTRFMLQIKSKQGERTAALALADQV